MEDQKLSLVSIQGMEERRPWVSLKARIMDSQSLANMLFSHAFLRSWAIFMLPNGLIASYKATMWHGGNVELLHSSVSEELDDDEQVSAAIQGGVSISLGISTDQEAVSWSPRNWALGDITGNPEESIQVELICTDSHDMVQVKYTVTLEDDQLVSKIMVSNKCKFTDPTKWECFESSHSELTRCYLCSWFRKIRFLWQATNFVTSTIIPPAEESQSRFNRLWMPFMNQNKANQRHNQEEMEEGEEDDNYKKLTEKMCRIYTSAPRDFTIIDRGTRNSVVIGRDGFEELYVYSHGSSHEYYGKYAYICVGQSAVLKSIILEPNGSWTGGQRLHDPNM